MTKDLIKRYIWLIDTINQAGDEGITFSRLAEKWEQNILVSGGKEYAWRTFMNHKKDVFELFGIQIECKKSSNSYRIADRRELKDAAGFKRWMFDALSLGNQLSESVALRGRVLLEDNPSGQEFVSAILEAMRNNKMLTFSYKPFWMGEGRVSNLFHVEPYALKYFKRRWYLLAKYGDNPLKIYALDRMLDIDIEFEDFTLPDDFDAEDFFNSCFGIIVGDEEPQIIKLKVDAFQANYLCSLPLHHSQKVVENTAEYTVFSYFLRPTFDFKQELLALGEQVEVLEPKDLRAEMASIGKTIAARNGKKK
ncbi:MAG: WYL domain-containing protein [Bacteroidales bacterium]|nr:WYL domain-containing protein [Bacteroidales bacterium]